MYVNSLGTKSLQEILSDRESIAQTMQVRKIDQSINSLPMLILFDSFRQL